MRITNWLPPKHLKALWNGGLGLVASLVVIYLLLVWQAGDIAQFLVQQEQARHSTQRS